MSRLEQTWKTPPAALPFPLGHIDVWRVRLIPDNLREEDFQGLLSPDEVSRASRFRFDRDRNRYARGRAGLRIVLGRYLNVPASEVRFQYENNGKPEIASPSETQGLCFNVSNSGQVVLIAATAGMPLGIDVEQLRPMPDLVNIANRFFSAQEVRGLLELSEDKRQEAFFACWTRKEAFLKATGAGLSYPLSAFSVSVDPDSRAEMLEIRGERISARRWSLHDLHAGEGCRAALAWEGGFRPIELWELEVGEAILDDNRKRKSFFSAA